MSASNASGSQFSVPDSFLGQVYQVWYALLLLLESGDVNPEAAVSVELVDDAAVHLGGAVTNAVQTKRTQTDLSDASVPLWKTLRIWSEHVARGVIDLSKVTLTLVTTSLRTEESAASKLRLTNRDESAALGVLNLIATTSTNRRLAKAFEAFNALGDAKAALLKQVRILDRSPDIANVKAAIARRLNIVAPVGSEEAFAEDLGHRWKAIVEAALESHALTTYRDLRNTITDLRDRYHAADLPIDFLDRHPDLLKTDGARFLRQLELIELTAERLEDARMDYLARRPSVLAGLVDNSSVLMSYRGTRKP